MKEVYPSISEFYMTRFYEDNVKRSRFIIFLFPVLSGELGRRCSGKGRYFLSKPVRGEVERIDTAHPFFVGPRRSVWPSSGEINYYSKLKLILTQLTLFVSIIIKPVSSHTLHYSAETLSPRSCGQSGLHIFH